MSKSLEILEMLKNNISDYLDAIQNNEETMSKSVFMFMCIYPLYELIKKDLERKEILELNLDSEKYHLVNENQNLKNRVEDLEISYKELEKENQQLKEELQDLKGNEDIVADYACSLWNKNEKYKKALEILKKFNFKLGQYGNGEYYILIYYAGIPIEIILTQQEYELLNEVLENDK